MVLKILCVDDDDSFRALFEFACQQQRDIRLTSVKSGEDALKHTAKDQFNLIMLDVLMPALDGPQTLDLLRAQSVNRDTPAVFMTAHGHPTEPGLAQSDGCGRCLAKEFQPKSPRWNAEITGGAVSALKMETRQ
jgi:two-component system, OmpR family, response regulator